MATPRTDDDLRECHQEGWWRDSPPRPRVTSTIEEGIPMPRPDDRNIVSIRRARAGSHEALGQLLDGCRGYLLRIARDELDPRLQAKGGASDLVQETFLEAQRDFAAFTG